MMNILRTIVLFYSLFITNIAASQNAVQNIASSLYFEKLVLDTLFDSKQIISILTVPVDQYSIQIAYNQQVLKTTSTFAQETDAIAAINAGFFNMKSGGSVTYMEINDSLISYTGGTRPENPPNDSLINGVVIINKLNKIEFEYKKPDSVYLNSLVEAAVLATGPVLILQGVKVKLAEKSFVSSRHPRTCLCLTDKELLMITVDGRSDIAEGMSLYELQEFLLSQNCFEAINLDGGGSTTMWLKEKGVVNHPSDESGERKVANVIIIKQNLN